ncbi:hypothetical protein [Thalassotalea litorea]|uniref:hypothetical protein n=1 Tax=Thalassotalea litorea TaxID=2020715 RepID=UPI0037360217
MKQTDNNLMQYLQRDFVADSPEQQQVFIEQAVKKHHIRNQKRILVFTIFGVLGFLALTLFFPIQPLLEITSAKLHPGEVSLSTMIMAILPILLIAYVVVLVENTR